MKSAARVLDVLELLARADRALTLSEIAVALGLPRSSTYLLLQTLVRRGYLEETESPGAFQLGLKVLEVAGAYARKADLLRQFSMVARRVVAACQETVQLAVLDGAEIIYIAKEDGTRPVRLVSDVGKRLPAHAPALGKVLLAALPDRELSARLSSRSLVQMTPRTISTLDQLKEELARVRDQGYGIDRQEVSEDLCCFAAPVYAAAGKVVAAISVSVPKISVSEDDIAHYVTLIKDAGAELSRRIGYTRGL